ncbi:hypothetical protein EOA13_31400 [Mesorhizobium sp. M7A.F.Ca.US.011.01.1.1]|uniref:hypothetical protein n=1 Tax=Mesorhizobium sp. M7A.F.Ca.US.011.01.1.1 TaxID=2496741 RepID=UPI000FC9A417|nr:hypothetical protein [Mesorhizobium sp. M7A.F.Ca.US.011.01.1.1]RUX24201.1 hypothetical protein EOA13_31400 [Mesorhizobium sp. M7A.F.Ca.US.011.01.1.1]
MSAREWSKLSPDVWRSPRFLSLGDVGAALLWHYYAAGPHANSSGCSCIPDGYILADFSSFGWTDQHLTEARRLLIEAELISHDPKTTEVFVDRWFIHNPPTNPSHAKGAIKLIGKIASDMLREKAEAEFSETDFGSKLNQLVAAANDPHSSGDRLTNTPFMSGKGRGRL